MSKPAQYGVHKAVDTIQQRLTNYACNLDYNDLPPEVIHAAKVRIIDTLGALVGGFFGEPCRIVRNLAAQAPDPDGATVIGTRMKTTPDMAAFVNATTARYVELMDSYHWPGSLTGHASDTVTPVLAAAEYAQVDGRKFITSVVLAYEVFLRICDTLHDLSFDNTNFACLGTAVAAGKLLNLSANELSHCISMAVVPNNILRQVRTGHLSMFKAAAPGQAGRAGVFAALLARAGMEGPHLPFEGKAGWCDHVAKERFSLDVMGGKDAPFKIQYTQIKLRPASGETTAPILAAEKLAPLKNIKEVRQIKIELYKKALDYSGTGEHQWNPDSRETADHSTPYVVAATLMDGTLTPRSFNDAHLWNPELRALIKKIKVMENPDFTKAFDRLPQEHHARVTVVTNSGETLVGESGGGEQDQAAPKSDAQIEDKFRGLTEDVFGAKRVNGILERVWHLEEVKNAATIPPAFIIA